MKRRILSLLLCMAMLFSLLPALPVSAAPTVPAPDAVYVDHNVSFSSRSPYYHNGSESSDSNPVGWNAYYDSSRGTLYLRDYEGWDISAHGGDSFTLFIEGTNTVRRLYPSEYNCIYANVDLLCVRGSGTLNLLFNPNDGMTSQSHGIWVPSGRYVQESGTVNIDILTHTEAFGITANGISVGDNDTELNISISTTKAATGLFCPHGAVELMGLAKVYIQCIGEDKPCRGIRCDGNSETVASPVDISCHLDMRFSPEGLNHTGISLFGSSCALTMDYATVRIVDAGRGIRSTLADAPDQAPGIRVLNSTLNILNPSNDSCGIYTNDSGVELVNSRVTIDTKGPAVMFDRDNGTENARLSISGKTIATFSSRSRSALELDPFGNPMLCPVNISLTPGGLVDIYAEPSSVQQHNVILGENNVLSAGQRDYILNDGSFRPTTDAEGHLQFTYSAKPYIVDSTDTMQGFIGVPAYFSVRAENTDSYCWYVCDEDGQDYPWVWVQRHADIIGRDTDHFTLIPLDTELNNTYVYCFLTNKNGSICSEATQFFVDEDSLAPYIADQTQAYIGYTEEIMEVSAIVFHALDISWELLDADGSLIPWEDAKGHCVIRSMTDKKLVLIPHDTWLSGKFLRIKATNYNGTTYSDLIPVSIYPSVFTEFNFDGYCSPLIDQTVQQNLDLLRRLDAVDSEDYPSCVIKMDWYDLTEARLLYAFDTFQEGHVYQLQIWPGAREGFMVSESAICNINHGEYVLTLQEVSPYRFSFVLPAATPEQGVTISVFQHPEEAYPRYTYVLPKGSALPVDSDLSNSWVDFAGWYTDRELRHPVDYDAPVYEDLSIYPLWLSKNDDFTIHVLSVGLTEKLELTALVKNDVLIEEAFESCFVTFTNLDSDDSRMVLWGKDAGTPFGRTHRMFTLPIYAAQMTDRIEVTVYGTGTRMLVRGGSVTISVREFLEAQIKHMNRDQQTMCCALVNYGTALQAHFNYRMEAPANEGFEAYQSLIPAETPVATGSITNTNHGLSGASLRRRAVSIGSVAQLQYAFRLENGLTAAEVEVVFEIDGVTHRISGSNLPVSGTTVYAIFDELLPTQADTPLKVTVCRSSDHSPVSETYTDMLSLALATYQTASDPLLSNVANTMLTYYRLAKKAFG